MLDDVYDWLRLVVNELIFYTEIASDGWMAKTY